MNKSIKMTLTRIQKLQFNTTDVLSFLAVIELVLLLINSFKFLYLQEPVNEYISWPLVDAGGEETQEFRLGPVHAFSDFMLPYIWASTENPWVLDDNHLAQYPPLAVFLIKPFSLFPYSYAISAFLLLTFFAVTFSVFWVTKNLKFRERLLISIPFGIGSVPILMAFDRGNNIGLGTCFFAIFLIAVVQGDKRTAVIALVPLIALKIYPIFFLAVFLKLRWFKQAIITLAFVFGISIFLFLITPGEFLLTVQGWIRANLFALPEQGNRAESIIAASLVDLHLASTNESLAAASGIMVCWNVFRYVLLFAIVATIILKRSIPADHLVLITAIAATLIYSAQLGYNWYWIPIFAAYSLANISRNGIVALLDFKNKNKVLLYSFWLWGFICLPLGLHFPGSTAPVTAWAATLIGAFIVYEVIKTQQTKQKSDTWENN
jgi:hypothetical protein